MNGLRRAAWVMVLLAAGPAAAQERIALTLSAGTLDRKNTVVCVPLLLPAALAKEDIIKLREIGPGKGPVHFWGQVAAPGLGAQEKPHRPGLVAVELHIFIDDLKAGRSLKMEVGSLGYPDREGRSQFRWRDTPGQLTELRLDNRPVLRYVYRPLDESSKETREETYKVFHHLFDPAGKRLVTKGPGGLYTHHRGLFYGFRKTTYGDGIEVDTWHCTGDTYQLHDKLLATEGGWLLGRQRVAISWHGKKKEVFAHEQREVTAYNVPGGILVDWVSRLETVGGPIRLDGDPQHAGFHFRADNEVAARAKDRTVFTRPDGPDRPGKTRNWPEVKTHVNLPWDAMTFVLGEKKYTVAYLDRPDNPKEARFSERDYGRFGSYFVREVTREKPLTVRYRIWLQEGPMTVDELAARSADFVEPVAVTLP
jgi:hypothetical protein